MSGEPALPDLPPPDFSAAPYAAGPSEGVPPVADRGEAPVTGDAESEHAADAATPVADEQLPEDPDAT